MFANHQWIILPSRSGCIFTYERSTSSRHLKTFGQLVSLHVLDVIFHISVLPKEKHPPKKKFCSYFKNSATLLFWTQLHLVTTFAHVKKLPHPLSCMFSSFPTPQACCSFTLFVLFHLFIFSFTHCCLHLWSVTFFGHTFVSSSF